MASANKGKIVDARVRSDVHPTFCSFLSLFTSCCRCCRPTCSTNSTRESFRHRAWILAIYTLSALIIRPFSGFIADSVVRKPLHVVCLLIFISLFAGYLFATTLLLIALLRAVHGMAFGMVTVSGSTLAIDIMPSSRRGEGLAFFGVTSSLAMATGPMSGLFLLKHYSYNTNFLTALASGLAAWLFVLFVRAAAPKASPPGHLARPLFPAQSTHGAIGLMMMASLYGALLSYVALFAREAGLVDEAGHFFVTLAFGVALSRLSSGKLIDRGRMVELIVAGKVIPWRRPRCSRSFPIRGFFWRARS